MGRSWHSENTSLADTRLIDFSMLFSKGTLWYPRRRIVHRHSHRHHVPIDRMPELQAIRLRIAPACKVQHVCGKSEYEIPRYLASAAVKSDQYPADSVRKIVAGIESRMDGDNYEVRIEVCEIAGREFVGNVCGVVLDGGGMPVLTEKRLVCSTL